LFTCGGLPIDVHVPPVCEKPGCGLILEIHGDSGTGPLQDAHLDLRGRSDDAGYVLLIPSTPHMIWSSDDDPALVEITRRAIAAFHVDPRKVHVTGFSRGGFVTWRLLCDHADLFASAAPAADGGGGREPVCFGGGRLPSRPVPILFLMGRTDHQVSWASMLRMRDGAIVAYQAGPRRVLAEDSAFAHTRWEGRSGAVVETFDHAYETVKDGPWGFAQGHCIPGSRVDPYGPRYALACKLPNGFIWGEEVMKFFRAHPLR
jgi:poly(3-hydroxybutyrate) depolymerase